MNLIRTELFKTTADELKILKEKYLKVKMEYEKREFEIITQTDFKTLYGQNNDKIRKGHVNKELGDKYKEMKELKDKIDYKQNILEYYKVTMNE